MKEMYSEEIKMLKKFLKTAILIGAMSFCSASIASTFDSKSITIISPFPPGGGTDTLTRMLADTMSQQEGWTIVVENKPGAGGNLALGSTARANPDGHTLVMAQTDNIVLNPWLYKSLPYDTFEDFAHIGLVASSPSVYVVTSDSELDSVGDLVDKAKENPGALTLGIPGVGGTGDLLGRLFNKEAEIELSYIPFRGWSQAFPDLKAGRIDIYTGSVASLLPQIQGGLVKPIGVIGEERSPALPDVPTFIEAGYPNVSQAIWWGLVAPAGTPEDIIDELNAAMVRAVNSEEMTVSLKAAGYSPIASTPEEHLERHRSDHKLFGELVRSSGIEPQ